MKNSDLREAQRKRNEAKTFKTGGDIQESRENMN
jgi:hypothetical protein